YMADMYGRLTQRAGVCLGTLGPGATNLITGVADAFLDRSPLVALTGQADLARMHKESHQHIDIVNMFAPVVKWNARLNSATVIPEVVRKAFKVAQEQKPGPTHIELPEDVMAEDVEAEPLPARRGRRRPEPSGDELRAAIDVVSMFKPITKWNVRLNSSRVIPEVVRKAFKVAQAQKPGPTHIELPEDVMGAQVDAEPLPARTTLRRPEPSAQELLKAADVIRGAINPVVLAGNGVARVGAAPALREFARATGIGVAETFMGKGLLDYEDPRSLGTVGLQSRDYALAGFEDADVVITVGYDLVEHDPVNWNPRGDKKIVCIDTVAPEVDEHFVTDVDLIGDMYYILNRLAEECRHVSFPEPDRSLRDLVMRHFEQGRHDDAFPLRPPRVLWELRQVLRREDILISDVGLHKLWIARMFPAHEPETVMIANGLAGMGIAVPTAIAAKLVHPERHVVTVNGDGGFLMNCQELETAVRLGIPTANIVWENQQFGSIVWKQDKKFGRHFGTDFTNPDFVKLAEAFGCAAFRCDSVDAFCDHLRMALALDRPSVIVVPIDYSIDVALSEELGTETVAT
ncbi:MAG: thiamine pyrophosphate-dependent enzyme, partial [Solirubrobacterales bacterium]